MLQSYWKFVFSRPMHISLFQGQAGLILNHAHNWNARVTPSLISERDILKMGGSLPPSALLSANTQAPSNGLFDLTAFCLPSALREDKNQPKHSIQLKL